MHVRARASSSNQCGFQTIKRFAEFARTRGAILKDIELRNMQVCEGSVLVYRAVVQAMNRAHTVIISSEMAAALTQYLPDHRDGEPVI